jgi:hypothetical protein
MNQSTQKFKKEIYALNSLKRERTLHPLLKEQVKQRILSLIARPENVQAPLRARSRSFKILRYLAPISAGILLCAGTVFASGGANPGDALYPVKIAKENVELALAPTAKAKAQVRAVQAENRLIELDKITAKNPTVQVSQQTKQTAKTEVQNAIKTLSTVRVQLTAQGDTKGANDLSNKISNLRQRAAREKLFNLKETDDLGNGK